jgi:hypothetical protein
MFALDAENSAGKLSAPENFALPREPGVITAADVAEAAARLQIAETDGRARLKAQFAGWTWQTSKDGKIIALSRQPTLDADPPGPADPLQVFAACPAILEYLQSSLAPAPSADPPQPTTIPAIDPAAITAHVALLHSLAAGLQGSLVLADTSAQSGNLKFRSFAIGDTAGMTAAIMKLAAKAGRNLSVPWVVMRPDWPGEHWRAENILAALAIITDRDHDKYQLNATALEPSGIIKAAWDNFQCCFIFTRSVLQHVEPELWRHRAKRFVCGVARFRSHRFGDHVDRRLQSLDSFALHSGTSRANGQ